jgi:hypothetical protein
MPSADLGGRSGSTRRRPQVDPGPVRRRGDGARPGRRSAGEQQGRDDEEAEPADRRPGAPVGHPVTQHQQAERRRPHRLGREQHRRHRVHRGPPHRDRHEYNALQCVDDHHGQHRDGAGGAAARRRRGPGGQPGAAVGEAGEHGQPETCRPARAPGAPPAGRADQRRADREPDRQPGGCRRGRARLRRHGERDQADEHQRHRQGLPPVGSFPQHQGGEQRGHQDAGRARPLHEEQRQVVQGYGPGQEPQHVQHQAAQHQRGQQHARGSAVRVPTGRHRLQQAADPVGQHGDADGGDRSGQRGRGHRGDRGCRGQSGHRGRCPGQSTSTGSGGGNPLKEEA